MWPLASHPPLRVQWGPSWQTSCPWSRPHSCLWVFRAGQSHLTPAGLLVLAQPSCLHLAVCTPSREVRFQILLCKHSCCHYREGAGLALAGRLPARRSGPELLFQPCVNIALVRGKAPCFSSPPSPKPFPKYLSRDYTAAVNGGKGICSASKGLGILTFGTKQTSLWFFLSGFTVSLG
jgi:hypothetical protein